MLSSITSEINNKYGSKKGLTRTIVHRIYFLLGLYQPYQKVDWSRVERIVFVCMGNICRSPIAEYVLKECGMACCSFGLSCTQGVPADPRARFLAKECSIDLMEHRATPVEHALFTASDLIVCMEPEQVAKLQHYEANHAQQTLLGLWHTPGIPYIHDPFNSNDHYFEKCVKIVIKATRNLSQARKLGMREWKNSTA